MAFRQLIILLTLSVLSLPIMAQKDVRAGTSTPMTREIYLAGGCFWGIEHFIKIYDGVTDTQVGYANSDIPTPTYREVCSGRTNAAETVRVVYDPDRTALSYLLEQFFLIIDPTSLNKQGNDVGTQYRTGIYYRDESDRAIIDRALENLQRQFGKKVVIEVMPLKNFHPAEAYHQDYLDENPEGYCHVSLSAFNKAKEHAACPPDYISRDKTLRN